MQQRQRLWGETAVYVDNDVDVDDVDDDEEGAAAYFFWSETAMAIPTVNYKSVEDKPLAWDSPGPPCKCAPISL